MITINKRENTLIIFAKLSWYYTTFKHYILAVILYSVVVNDRQTSCTYKEKNRSLRGHVLTGNECYTINIVYVIVDMLL